MTNRKSGATALRERGTAVATRVNDAYMTGLYGEREWAKVGRWLAGPRI